MSPRHRWLRLSFRAAAIVIATATVGCGTAGVRTTSVSLRPDQRPVVVGRGPGFQPPAVPTAVARRAQVHGLRCSAAQRPRFGAHLELFARGRVLIVPAGIGIAPPQRRSGAYVLGGSCAYPLRTTDPTGVVIVDRGTAASLGTFFALWGQSLSRTTLASFRGRVHAFLNGEAWRSAPQAIPLDRHAEIVLEVDGDVLPHPSYRFPLGL